VLTVLLGNLSLAENQLPQESEALEPLRTAKRASLQAQNLVQQLLVFARGGQPIRQKVQLGDVFRVFRAEHQEMPDIHYVWEIPEQLPETLIDPSQLRRLLGNLVRNSEQALGKEGEILVSAEIIPSAEFSQTCLSGLPEGPVLRLVVRDNGPGIPDEDLSRIFDPFFSTRRDLNASGLGLTVCEAIARSHGGQITVESSSGSGTTVTTILPLPAAQAPAKAASHACKGRVLILEDETLIRSLMTMQLGEAGWDVVSTIEGSETIHAYETALKEQKPFDVVIVDLSIPNGMGGLKTVSGLRKINPGVKAIVSSGYSDDPAMAQPAEYGFTAVLPKPYEPAHLVSLVEKVARNGNSLPAIG
jgi:CheY-like chemotaxis protein